MFKISFKEFVLRESKNVYIESFGKLLKDVMKDIESAEEGEKKEEIKDGGSKVLKAIEKLINLVVKEGSYLESKELVDGARKILKDSGIVDKEVEKYFEASLDSSKREKFEDSLRSKVSELKSVGKKEKENKEEDEKEDDKDIEKEAKSKAKDDEKLEKEIEKEIEDEKKGKKIKKILIGIVKKEEDGEVVHAIIGETDSKEKDIEGLEYEEDVLSHIHNARDLKNPAQIAKRIKELKGSVVYYFDFDKKENDKEFLSIVKI